MRREVESLWTTALGRGLIVGSVASVASMVALGRGSAVETTGTNAITRRLYGDRAKRGVNARSTLPSYLIHHASSVLWGVVYEKFFRGRERERTPNSAFAEAAAVAAIAAASDYLLAPRRLTAGFEAPSLRSTALVYATFAAGLLGARYVLDRTEAQRLKRIPRWRRVRR